MTIVNADNTTLILIIEYENAIIPINPLAFSISQSSKAKLNKNYSGAFVISRDGKMKIIEHIDVLGFWGDSLGSKFINAILGVRKIKVHFEEERPMDLEDFKELIIRYIK